MAILIIKLGALGDVVMATSFIHGIQSAHRGEEVWLLTTPAYQALFDAWPDLQVKAVARKGAGAMLSALRWLRSQRFRRLYDLQSNDRTRLLCALSGVPERVGNYPGIPYTHHPATRYASDIHIFERMNQVMVSAGLTPVAPLPYLPAAEEDVTVVRDWLQAHDLSGRSLALLHAGASPRWPSKRWPHYAALARALSEVGLQVVWVGAGEDASRNATLAAQCGTDASNAFSIVQLAELGRHARFAVTNDSGPMHILSASDIPVFACFGPTRWIKNHALGQQARVLRHAVPCSPCQLADCPADYGHVCMEDLTVESVLQRLAAEGLLTPV